MNRMVGLEKLNEISSMTTYRVKDASKVHDVIQKLNIETKYFAILVNGQKADSNMQIERNDEILVLPKISGGK